MRRHAAECGTRSGYTRHQRLGEPTCPDCKAACAEAMRSRRANAPKRPCTICRRVHPGRCIPEDARSYRLGITLPGRIGRRLHEIVPWGDRSKFIARLVEAELDRLEERAA